MEINWSKSVKRLVYVLTGQIKPSRTKYVLDLEITLTDDQPKYFVGIVALEMFLSVSVFSDPLLPPTGFTMWSLWQR